jgi:hypothetical protein
MNRNYVLGALVALASFGCATPHTTADSRVASKGADKMASAAAAEHCVKDTGSYIKRPDRQCNNNAGTSYSQQELEDTGRISTADALKQLDPRIQ